MVSYPVGPISPSWHAESHLRGTPRKAHENTPLTDKDLWDDPDVFRPERWLEKPDAPLFTFGLGYRMCAGHLLAMRELYLIFMRLIGEFKLEPHGHPNMDPKTGGKNPADLIAAPHRYKVYFVPRNETRLRKALGEVKEEV